MFHFSIGLRRREGGGENFQDPLAARNSLGLSLDGGIESEDSGISVIKCL